VENYSLEGMAFMTDRRLALEAGDELRSLSLRIPEEGEWFVAEIPSAMVKRIESSDQPRAFLYALEFTEQTEPTRKRLARHIFEKQRHLLRKFGKNLTLSHPRR
jgi:c-di-GMP-binding flagellar brake protein YcgR